MMNRDKNLILLHRVPGRGVPDLLSGSRSGRKNRKKSRSGFGLGPAAKSRTEAETNCNHYGKISGDKLDSNWRCSGPKSIILLSLKVFYLPSCTPEESLILLKLIHTVKGGLVRKC